MLQDAYGALVVGYTGMTKVQTSSKWWVFQVLIVHDILGRNRCTGVKGGTHY